MWAGPHRPGFRPAGLAGLPETTAPGVSPGPAHPSSWTLTRDGRNSGQGWGPGPSWPWPVCVEVVPAPPPGCDRGGLCPFLGLLVDSCTGRSLSPHPLTKGTQRLCSCPGCPAGESRLGLLALTGVRTPGFPKPGPSVLCLCWVWADARAPSTDPHSLLKPIRGAGLGRHPATELRAFSMSRSD